MVQTPFLGTPHLREKRLTTLPEATMLLAHSKMQIRRFRGLVILNFWSVPVSQAKPKIIYLNVVQIY